jgi:hypothetical protein
MNDPHQLVVTAINRMVKFGNETRRVLDKCTSAPKLQYDLWKNICMRYNDPAFYNDVAKADTLAVNVDPKWVCYRTPGDLKSMFGAIKSPYTVAKAHQNGRSGQNDDGT